MDLNAQQNKVQKISALADARDIQGMLNRACELLGNPVLAHDMDYKIISYTQNTVTDDPIWNEFVKNGMVGPERLEFYKNECFFEIAANAKKVTFLLSDQLKYGRIYGKLFTKNNIQVGCACMVACYRPFEEDTAELFELFCDILNNKLAESAFYQNYGQAYFEALACKLVRGDIKDKLLYVAHVESIYIGMKENLYLAVTDIQACGTCAGLKHFRDLFKQTCPVYKYFIYSNKVVMLIGTDSGAFRAKKDLQGLYSLFEQNNIYVGVSSSFYNLFELSKYYDEAVTALCEGVEHRGKQRVFLFHKKKHAL